MAREVSTIHGFHMKAEWLQQAMQIGREFPWQ